MVRFDFLCVRPAKVCRMLLSLLLLTVASRALVRAQPAVSFTGANTIVPATGLSSPEDVAVDVHGNLFILNGGSAGVVEIPAGGGGTQINIPVPGLVGPEGLAVDAADDVFIADYTGGVAIELPAGGGTPITFAKGLGDPSAVAVDGNGNVFLAYANTGVVLEYAGVSGAPRLTGTPVTLGLSLSSPRGIAVDGTGNLFIADVGLNAVVEYPWTGSAWGTQTSLKIQSPKPSNVSVDQGGNVFITDYSDQTVEEIQQGGGDIALGSFYYPNGIGADEFDNIYVVSAPGNGVVEVQVVSANFHNQGIGVSSTPEQLNFTISGNVKIGGISILTNGYAGQDFADAGGSTCTAMSYDATTQCTVNVKFTPKAPGLRHGEVVFSTSKGGTVQLVPLQGIGVGPEVVFRPGTPSTIASKALSAVASIAIDGKGNLFVADAGNNAVEELTAASGYTAVTTLASTYTKGGGFKEPLGVALDGAGNVWVGCDDGSLQVIFAVGGYTDVYDVGSVGTPVWGMAVDGSGNLFFAVPELNLVGVLYEFGDYVYAEPLPAKLNAPVGLALDENGDLFVSSLEVPQISELKQSDGYKSVTSIPTNLQGPGLLALDAAGDIYITDSTAGNVEELLASSGYATINTLAKGYTNIAAIAVGAEGNVWLSNIENGGLLRLDYADAPMLSFKNTNVGSTSSDSPMQVQVANIGTQELSMTDVVSPTDFPEGRVSEPADRAHNAALEKRGCDVPGVVAMGDSCTLPIDFSPQSAGLLTENVTLTDNAMNVNNAMQRIGVQGTGVQVAQTITFGTIATQRAGTTLTLSATASSSLPVSFSSLTTAVCTVARSTASFVAAGTCSIKATQAGDAEYLAAPPVTRSFQVTGLPQTITFPTIPSQAVFSTVKLAATTTSKLTVSFASLTAAVCTVSGTTASLIDTGTCTVQATQAGNATYLAAAPVNESFTVTKASQTITFNAPINGLNGTSVNLAATASSGLTVSYTSLSTKQCVVAGSKVSLLNQGDCVIQAAQGGSSVYAAATPVDGTIRVIVK